MSLRSPSKVSHSGFTLLEVMIAMAILTFISYSIFQAIHGTYRLREALSTEGDFYNGVRMSTTLMQRDIAMIYSPLMTYPELKPKPTDPPLTFTDPRNADLALTSIYWSPAVSDKGIRPSRFIGTESKISFVSVSNVRIYRDSPESDFLKVAYEIKRDEQDKEGGTYVLTKTETPNAFVIDDTFKDPFVRTYALLRGIKKFTFTYYLRDGQTWKTFRSWDSDKEETRFQVPAVIELKMDVEGPKKQIFEGLYKFRPELPLDGLTPTL